MHDSGSDLGGLIRYLVGPGKANEHTNPQVVSASGTIAQEFTGTDWDRAKREDLAQLVDGAWRQVRREQGLPLQVGTEDAGRGVAHGGHVFHTSLSLGADQGALTKEQWGQIAAEYVDGMGFAGPQSSASGRAPCQWVAVHHGLSKNGGDHIHIAVCLVREDSTRAAVRQSFRKSRSVTDGIESRHGLRPVKDTSSERGLPGYNKGEAARAQRQGDPEVGKATIARRLRAASAVSRSEQEFVRSARLAGVMVRPRFAAKGTDQVIGYSAALRPAPGQKPLWYAPSKLDRNLGLGQLRTKWGVDRRGGDSAGLVATEVWQAPDRASAAGRGPKVLPSETARELSALTGRLAATAVEDREAWRVAAREASEVFARWSLQVEGAQPGPLAQASDALARSAQPDRDVTLPRRDPTLAARQIGLAVRATSSSSAVGWLAVMSQMDRLTQAIEDAHRARAELQASQRIGARTGVDLGVVRQSLVDAAARETAALEDAAEGADAVAHRAGTAPAPGQQAPAGRDTAGTTGQPESDAERASRQAAASFPLAPGARVHRRGVDRPPPAAPPSPARRDRSRERQRDGDQEREM